jgi:hypothetical protein
MHEKSAPRAITQVLSSIVADQLRVLLGRISGAVLQTHQKLGSPNGLGKCISMLHCCWYLLHSDRVASEQFLKVVVTYPKASSYGLGRWLEQLQWHQYFQPSVVDRGGHHIQFTFMVLRGRLVRDDERRLHVDKRDAELLR